MSERLAFVQLDARGLDYVREHLTGVNLFCTALAETLLTAPGVVFTLAPFGTEPERLHRFSQGGLLPANRSDGPASLKIEQGAYLLSLLREEPARICIVDDFNPSWAEVQMGDDARAFGVEDEVYRMLTAEDPPEAFLDALVLSDTIWHGAAAICAAAPELDEDRLATPTALQGAAQTVIALTCTAYDGEGFVAWSRTPQRPTPKPQDSEDDDFPPR